MTERPVLRQVRAPKSRILVAGHPDAMDRLRRILDGHDLACVTTLDEATRRIEEDWALVVVGVHFDQSQMFELIHQARFRRHHRKVPILCVLALETRLADIAVQGLDHAVKAMMANAFADLRKVPDDERGNSRIRRIADYLILLDGELHQGIADDE